MKNTETTEIIWKTKKNNAINTTTPVSNNMTKVVEYDFSVYKIRFIY